MDTTVRELDLTSSVEVEGTVPAELDGYFLQVTPHPTGSAERASVVTGLRVGGGRVELHRGPNPLPAPLTAPLPRTEGVIAKPVREAAAPLWHTVATYPGRDYADHITMADDGTVLRTEPFPLPDAPLVQLAVTEQYLVVIDSGAVHNRAAALLGSPVRYARQVNRPARIGLLPLRPNGPAARWFAIEPCRVSQAVNAYEHDHGVVLDAVRHDDQDAQVCRWELDLTTGTVRTRRLTGAVDLTTVDGPRHRDIFATNVDDLGEVTLSRYDLTTWRTTHRPLGVNLRASQPVYALGWLLVLVEDPVHRSAALLVLDANDVAARPVATVHIPFAMPASGQATWVSI